MKTVLLLLLALPAQAYQGGSLKSHGHTSTSDGGLIDDVKANTSVIRSTLTVACLSVSSSGISSVVGCGGYSIDVASLTIRSSVTFPSGGINFDFVNVTTLTVLSSATFRSALRTFSLDTTTLTVTSSATFRSSATFSGPVIAASSAVITGLSVSGTSYFYGPVSGQYNMRCSSTIAGSETPYLSVDAFQPVTGSTHSITVKTAGNRVRMTGHISVRNQAGAVAYVHGVFYVGSTGNEQLCGSSTYGCGNGSASGTNAYANIPMVYVSTPLLSGTYTYGMGVNIRSAAHNSSLLPSWICLEEVNMP